MNTDTWSEIAAKRGYIELDVEEYNKRAVILNPTSDRIAVDHRLDELKDEKLLKEVWD